MFFLSRCWLSTSSDSNHRDLGRVGTPPMHTTFHKWKSNSCFAPERDRCRTTPFQCRPWPSAPFPTPERSFMLESPGLLVLLLFHMFSSIHAARSSLPGKMARDGPLSVTDLHARLISSSVWRNSYSGHFLWEFTKICFFFFFKSLPLGLSLLLFGGIEINSLAPGSLLVYLFGLGVDRATSARKP